MLIKKVSLLFLGFVFLLSSFGLPKNLEKKVQKEVKHVFSVEEFSKELIKVPETIVAKLPLKLSVDNFFKVSSKTKNLGYVFVDKAASKTAMFDYLIVFNSDLEIIHSKVLIYREEYGGEIGSKRWLKQFIGKTGEDRVNHETNIDGISGATISVRSMTNAIDNVLQTIGILQENKVL
ncbi:FMN-binding protein [uncultured Maribacter sp.]|uniref:FMN-binding protein n=1 Tax=uncultured Maribacter sp. TaxID=431308 RepID=UPI00260A1466|nr:FMN-binding protein [uncultured Maribacter sp.]